MVQDTIRYRLSGVVLRVEGFADHVDVRLLAHVLRRKQPKLQVSTGKGRRATHVLHKLTCMRGYHWRI